MTRNDITGDAIQTKVNSDAYRNNYDLIFRKTKYSEQQTEEVPTNQPVEKETVQPQPQK